MLLNNITASRYIGNGKLVYAVPMVLGVYMSIEDDSCCAAGNVVSEYNDEGYVFRSAHGAPDWLPKPEFEHVYTLVTNLPFYTALEGLMLGQRISRVVWNPKELWLTATVPMTTKSDSLPCSNLASCVAANGGGYSVVAPYIAMMCVSTCEITPWTPTQADMFASDWVILD